jgi:nucleotide-binding universal stress UspA family protein
MFDNVMIGVGDHDGGLDAIALARQLVSSSGSLLLVAVQLVSHKPSADSGFRREAHERRDLLEALASLRDEAEVDAQTTSVEGLSVARGLHAVARLGAADLLVVGTSRAGDVDRLLSGDDTREVVRDAPCAVAVAPLGYASRSRPFTEVGIAYDGSPVGDRAVETARAVAANSDAKLSALHAIPTADMVEETRLARQQIRDLGGIEPHVRFGDAAEEIARFEPSVDLLVIAAHEHGRVDRFLRQSTSETLAERPTSPLLVLPSSDNVRPTTQ